MKLPALLQGSPLATLVGAIAVLGTTCAAMAATGATGQIGNTAGPGGSFTYTVVLTNTGTTPIETFWFGWVPGEDFMATRPSNTVPPTGWAAIITGGGGGDGFAIQWTTSSTPLTPGASLSFSFDSNDTPAAMSGNSVFFPSTPVETSFVYEGAPFTGGSSKFVVGGGSSNPDAPKVKISGSKEIRTGLSKITIHGKATGGATSVTYRVGSKKAKTASGTSSWRFAASLKKGKNIVTIIAHGPSGASAPVKITITRI